MQNFTEDRGSANELILNPGEYAFIQDKTKGSVATVVGPLVVPHSGQSRPVKFQGGTFRQVGLYEAVERCVKAEKGEYLILHNPTQDGNGLNHPETRKENTIAPELRYGEKIVIPGPCQFALWPEQRAEVVKGHNLRDDQFLVVRVYDEDEAVANWGEAVVKASDTEDDEETVATADAEDLGLTLGKLLIIKNVSFYIPPTGVEAVANEDGLFVRDALTLEMGEYAILVDQSGNKRYERGPQIVFPEPTEEFFSEGGSIKFAPIELTPTQGLHIKINCDYEDRKWPTPEGTTTSRKFSEGDEIFITGETHPIYYPREEHSIVRYGDNLIHYATAVPAGQGRYILDKNTGEHRTVEGPAMILLDPTEEVFLTRVLSDNESLLMYPGNMDSLEYNRDLRSFQAKTGVQALMSSSDALGLESLGAEEEWRDATLSATRGAGGPRKMTVSNAALPDQMRRKTQYTEPHSVTLDDNKFRGVPTLRIWTGFAVMLVRADGTRRVEVGPKTVLLDYDETVQALHFSTGKPKTTDALETTGYLEVSNNKVSDIIEVETEDGVKISLKVSYRVSFTGNDPEKWFEVDNYVKFLCDHARSRLKGSARNFKVREYYNETVDIVRDTILGKKGAETGRPGLLFKENGMHVTDVELLSVSILDSKIADLLSNQQSQVITNEIQIDRANQDLELARAQQKVQLQKLQLSAEVEEARHKADMIERQHETALNDFEAEVIAKRDAERIDHEKLAQEAHDLRHSADLARRTADVQLQITEATATTEQIVERFKACEGDLARAINQLGDEKVLQTVAEAVGPMSLIGDFDLSSVLAGLIGSAGQKSELFDRLTSGHKTVETSSGLR